VKTLLLIIAWRKAPKMLWFSCAPTDTHDDFGLQGQSGRVQGQTYESGPKDMVKFSAQADTHDHYSPQDTSGRA
jgi:hypothetical protein